MKMQFQSQSVHFSMIRCLEFEKKTVDIFAKLGGI